MAMSPSLFDKGRQPQLPIHNTIGIRFFSKFSNDSNEVIVPDASPKHSTTQKIPSNASTAAVTPSKLLEDTDHSTKPSVDYLKFATNKRKNLIQLKQAYVTLQKTCIDSQALLKNNSNASTSDEIVAMADYFMVLVNSIELETSIETIQTLQFDEQLSSGDSIAKNVLSQAVESMQNLHSIFLRVVENCIPSTADAASASPKPNREETPAVFVSSLQPPRKYSPMTMGRALQVSRRAEELGMPMHRPLYQRMAVGIVLTCPLPFTIRDPGQWPWEQDQGSSDDAAEVTKPEAEISTQDHNAPTLILPGQFQQVKEGLYMPPLTMELLNLCHRAKVALGCSFFPSMPLKVQMEQSRQQHQLEVDMFAEPWLLLLQRRQFEEALGLLRGWESNFGRNKESSGSIALLPMLGEDNVLKALEIAKDWVVGTAFGDEIISNPHANELISLLQVSLAKIIERRRLEAGRLSHLINTLSAIHGLASSNNSEAEDDEFDEDDSDSDFDSDGFDSDEFDSDSEDDEASDTISELLARRAVIPQTTNITSENFPLLLKGVGISNKDANEVTPEKSGFLDDVVEVKTNLQDTGASTPAVNNVNSSNKTEEEDVDEPPIIEGLSNEEVRRGIYLRKGPDWELPDVVCQLEEWNKGKALRFTPEFERHLGWQMSADDDDDWS
eukprot:CCRYP_020414-RA/>CCRYP_020414-RA protein AED:0.11 eAED:0.11 QI:0/-1/0/1/-1/1/1/0/668